MPWRSPPAASGHKLDDELGPQERPVALHPDHPRWQKDERARSCLDCGKEFTLFRRRHHCRRCGFIFCGDCVHERMHYTNVSRAQRTCRLCRNLLHSALVARDRQRPGQSTAAPSPDSPPTMPARPQASSVKW